LPAARDGAGNPIEVVGHGATSPRASNSLKRSLPRKNVSSICCPVTSSASRLVLLNWPPPDHLWIGTKSRHVA
jgi:hypothetical protein